MLKLSKDTIQKIEEARKALENDLKKVEQFYNENYDDRYILSLADGVPGYSYSRWMSELQRILSSISSVPHQSVYRNQNVPIPDEPETIEETPLGHVWYEKREISIGMGEPIIQLIKCEIMK